MSARLRMALLAACAVLACTVAGGAARAADVARTLVVRGRVLAADGSPLAGAHVSARGSLTVATLTDDRGRFTVSAALGSIAGLRREPFALELRAEQGGRRLPLASGAPALGIEISVVPATGHVRVRSNTQAATTAIASAFAQPGMVTAWVEVDFGGAGRASGSMALGVVDEVDPSGRVVSVPQRAVEPLPPAPVRVHAPDTVATPPARPAVAAPAPNRARASDSAARAPSPLRAPDSAASHDLPVRQVPLATPPPAPPPATSLPPNHHTEPDAHPMALTFAPPTSAPPALAPSTLAPSTPTPPASPRSFAPPAPAPHAVAPVVPAPAAATHDSAATLQAAPPVRTVPAPARAKHRTRRGAHAAPPVGVIAGSAVDAPSPPGPASSPAARPRDSRDSRIVPIQPFSAPPPAPAEVDTCACRVRGTVEVDWDRPLERDFPVELSLEGPAIQRGEVEMFIGSPREFRFGPLPCGDYRLVVRPQGRIRYTVARGDSVVRLHCAGLSQVRVVLEPHGH